MDVSKCKSASENETLPLSSACNHQCTDMKEEVHISIPVLKAETKVSCSSFFRFLPSPYIVIHKP